MNRDQTLLQIRSEINTEQKENMSEHEVFQNTTLRPLLKFQNDHLIEVFKSSRVCTQSKFATMDNHGKSLFIEQSLKQNKSLRDNVIISVTALMTSDEFLKYQTNASETNKRIITMTIERLKSVLCI